MLQIKYILRKKDQFISGIIHKLFMSKEKIPPADEWDNLWQEYTKGFEKNGERFLSAFQKATMLICKQNTMRLWRRPQIIQAKIQ